MSNATELLGTSIGLGGAKIINDTNRHNGKYRVIHALADTVFDEFVDSTLTGTITGITIKQGTSIGGHVTTIKLISGTIIAYE